MASEKIKILEAVLELDWQCCLVGSSKMAPRIFIFLIVLGAEYLSYIVYIISVLVSVWNVFLNIWKIPLRILDENVWKLGSLAP